MSLKLNLCCGGNILDGWENHDAEVDITQLLPWGVETVDYILCEHGLEHISGPLALMFIDDCYRILKAGGTLRLCVPVLDRLNWDKRRDIIVNHGHLVPYSKSSLAMLVNSSHFKEVIIDAPRMNCDGHWKVIGREQDDLETCRIDCIK